MSVQQAGLSVAKSVLSSILMSIYFTYLLSISEPGIASPPCILMPDSPYSIVVKRSSDLITASQYPKSFY